MVSTTANILGDDLRKSEVMYMMLVVALTRVMLKALGSRAVCAPRSSLTHTMSALALVEQTAVLPGKPQGG